MQTEDFQKDYEAIVKRHEYFADFWTFKRCSVHGTMFHSEAYKKVTVTNNYTVQINEATAVEQFGLITTFFKVANPCRDASCFIKEKCSCICEVAYYAVVKQFDLIKAPAFHYEENVQCACEIKRKPISRKLQNRSSINFLSSKQPLLTSVCIVIQLIAISFFMLMIVDNCYVF